MNAIRRVVVAALLAVWCFPAVSMAKSAPQDPAPLSAQVSSTAPAAEGAQSGAAETESLATREQKARQLQDFKGGAVYIYLGGGGLLILVVVLLILLV
jgi:hypothetical protein